ncbi:MAG: hypothetical protein FWE90_06265 [Defluviitaleaceae bacterium]|nr:hypothetical protein [Defluviitaleaceae bacterium]
MSNEDRILSLLETVVQNVNGLNENVSVIKTDITEMKADIAGLKQGQIDMENEITGIKHEISGIKVIIENEIDKNIRMLAEGHLDLVRRLDYITPIVENRAEEVSVITAVVSSHSRKFAAIREAI